MDHNRNNNVQFLSPKVRCKPERREDQVSRVFFYYTHSFITVLLLLICASQDIRLNKSSFLFAALFLPLRPPTLKGTFS